MTVQIKTPALMKVQELTLLPSYAGHAPGLKTESPPVLLLSHSTPNEVAVKCEKDFFLAAFWNIFLVFCMHTCECV